MDTRTLDFINRIKQEQEDRQRSIDDFQFQVNLKEKNYIEQEKSKAYFIFKI